MKITNTAAAANGNNHLYKALRDIEQWMTGTEKQLGLAPVGSQQASPDQRVAPPQPPILVVTSGNGVYSIEIHHNTADPDTVYHMQLQYSPTVPFDASSNLTTTEIMGDDVTTSIVLPNTALYFRARAKFNNSDWSAWVNGPGLVFANGAGGSGSGSVYGFAGATLLSLHGGGTKAASAVVVGDVLQDLSGTGVSVTAVFSFDAQANANIQTTNGGPLALGGNVEVVQADGNFKIASDLQLGDTALVSVGGANIGDAVTSLVANAPAILYAFRTNGSQTMNAGGIWTRIRI